MSYRNREIEIKLLARNAKSIKEVDTWIKAKLAEEKRCRPIIVGSATDIYWAAPDDSEADFVRVRELDDADENGLMHQMTLKYSDKGSNINRVEVDVPIGNKTRAEKFLTYLLGDPLGQVTKDYTVHFLEDEHTTISVYQIIKDPRVFVEVEGKSLRRVKELITQISGMFEYVRVQQSLFQMFVEKVPMTTEPV